jgi:hypothetical protein
MAEARDLARAFISDSYSSEVVLFEHGSVRYKEAGSCVEHAHLHALPLTTPIVPLVQRHLGPGVPASLEFLRTFHGAGLSYVYVEERGVGRAYRADFLPCQFLREIVGELTSLHAWAWQDTYKTQHSQRLFRRTLERLIPCVDDMLSPAQSK